MIYCGDESLLWALRSALWKHGHDPSLGVAELWTYSLRSHPALEGRHASGGIKVEYARKRIWDVNVGVLLACFTSTFIHHCRLKVYKILHASRPAAWNLTMNSLGKERNMSSGTGRIRQTLSIKSVARELTEGQLIKNVPRQWGRLVGTGPGMVADSLTVAVSSFLKP